MSATITSLPLTTPPVALRPLKCGRPVLNRGVDEACALVAGLVRGVIPAHTQTDAEEAAYEARDVEVCAWVEGLRASMGA